MAKTRTETKEASCAAGGDANGAAAVEESREGPQNVKKSTTLWPSAHTTGYLRKENDNTHSKRHVHPMFTAALLTTAKTWTQPKSPSVDESVDKEVMCLLCVWYMSTMEYYSALKNEILSFVTTQMVPEGIRLSAIRQTEQWPHMTSRIGGI